MISVRGVILKYYVIMSRRYWLSIRNFCLCGGNSHMYTGYDIISGLNTSELTFPKRWTEPSLAAASVEQLLIVANAGKVDYQ